MTAPASPWSDLEGRDGPVWIAHRGGAQLAPENTIEAMRLAQLLRADALETDVYVTADGALFVMHDGTTTRTTNLTGTQATQLTAASALRGRVDAGTWFANTWPSDLRIPLLSDVLDDVGDRIPIIVHCNNTGSGDVAVPLIVDQELADAVLVMAWGESELVAARAAGIPTCLLSPTGTLTGQTYAGLLTAGTGYLGVDASQTSTATMQAIMDAGLRLMVYTVNSRTVAALLPAGVWAVISDDPWYVQGTAATNTRDLFSAGTFHHGMRGIHDVIDYRGFFTPGSPAWWGLDGTPATAPAAVTANGGYVSCLQGYLGPLTPQFTLDLDVVIDTASYATASAQVTLTVGDTPYDDQGGGTANPPGYNILLRSNGTLDVYSITAGIPDHIGTLATAAVTAGSVQHLRITATDTQLTVARTNIAAPNTLTVPRATYRDALYPHLGVRGLRARWANLIAT